jgi:hypothetical protein
VKDLLTGAFDDLAGEAEEITVETSRGPWTLYSFPLNTEEVAALASFGESAEGASAKHNLEQAVDLLVLLAREQDGKRMFRDADKSWLLTRVDPKHNLEAAEKMFEAAGKYLDEMQGRAAGNSETPTSAQ